MSVIKRISSLWNPSEQPIGPGAVITASTVSARYIAPSSAPFGSWNTMEQSAIWGATKECRHCETKLSDDLQAMRAQYCSADCARAAQVAARLNPAPDVAYTERFYTYTSTMAAQFSSKITEVGNFWGV